MPRRHGPALLSDYEPIQVEFGGKTYDGSFLLDEGWVTVTCPYGSKGAALGRLAPKQLARILIREMIRALPIPAPEGS